MTSTRIILNRKAVWQDSLRFAKMLTLKKLTNYTALLLSYSFSVIFKKAKIKGVPCSLTLETSTACNLSCPECPTGTAQLTRPIGVITERLYNSTVDQTEKYLMNLNLYFQGEPFLNPKFCKLLSYAHEQNIYTSCSTNGHFLTEPFAKRVIESGIDRLIISIDGTDQESYSRYRHGGDFETVVNGVKNIVEAKKNLNASNPLVIIQFLVFKTNEHLIDEMKTLARKLGADVLELKTARFNKFEQGNPLMPVNENYCRYKKQADGSYSLKKTLKNKCFRMWTSSVITWDGTVVPCCFDKDAENSLGTLTTKTFKEIWKSEKYDTYRNQILNNRTQIEICRNCTS